MITSFFARKGKSKSPDDTAKSLNAKREQPDEVNDESSENKKIKISHMPRASSLEVAELLAHLEGESNPSVKSWRQALSHHLSSLTFQRLAKYVAAERKSQTIYPPACDTFSALNLTPLDHVKVVIVGQDPYHGPSQAHGLSFSVRKGVKVPMSLRNIYKELTEDPNVDFPASKSPPTHGYLERWAKQGVLMLNAVLTVRQGTPKSHEKRGWESFTDEVISALDRECRANGRGLVFLLWGRPASVKTQAILQNGVATKHKIICTSHPSPLGARKTDFPFLSSRCFSRANDALIELGMEPIDWNVDGCLK